MVSIRILVTVGVAAATARASNVLRFVSTDTNRTIYITPNAGVDDVDPVTVAAGATVNVILVQGPAGNASAISGGATVTPGMLAEVNFQGWNGITYFGVSAIVNAADHDGVHKMYLPEAKTPTSGCSHATTHI